MFPPSTLLPHPNIQPVTEPQFEFPELYTKFPLAVHFTYGIVNFYVTLSIHFPLSLLSSPHIYRSVFYVCFSFVALKINSSLPSLSVQFSSVTESCPTLCDPMDCSTPGLFVHHQLPEFTHTYVHRVGNALQPSHPLLSPSLPALNLS